MLSEKPPGAEVSFSPSEHIINGSNPRPLSWTPLLHFSSCSAFNLSASYLSAAHRKTLGIVRGKARAQVGSFVYDSCSERPLDRSHGRSDKIAGTPILTSTYQIASAITFLRSASTYRHQRVVSFGGGRTALLIIHGVSAKVATLSVD